LADAAAEDLTGEIEERAPDNGEDLLRPIMPHRLFGDEELDALYPAFNAPAEVDNPDAAKDEDDSTLQHGWKLASEICRDMQNYGRTRREAWHRPGVDPVASDSLSSHGVGVCLWSRGGPGDASGHQALPPSFACVCLRSRGWPGDASGRAARDAQRRLQQPVHGQYYHFCR